MTSSEDLYQAELAQSDQDHHTPTAGAMTGHVIANLILHSLKIRQARWFARGGARLYLDSKGSEWTRRELAAIDSIDQALIAEGEALPTTTEQFQQYGKLTEEPAAKYDAGEEQLFALVKDFDSQLLFIPRAIALAHQEHKNSLAATLVELEGWMRAQIADAQAFLGHDLKFGLYIEEDDDDDD